MSETTRRTSSSATTRAESDLRRRLRRLSSRRAAREALGEALSSEQIRALLNDWWIWARDDQLPFAPEKSENPDPPWRTWIILGGRGAGKTRAGAEWIRAVALGIPPLGDPVDASDPPRIALVGGSLAEARSVMVEGVSGLLAVHAENETPTYNPSLRRVTWSNGARAELFSAQAPESLRGAQFHAAWCDELCKWRDPDAAWAMLQFGMRLGKHPRVAVTTTPRPIRLLKEILNEPDAVATRASTFANRENLPESFLRHVRGRYGGTRLGRQELDAKVLDDAKDALWKRDDIERLRLETLPVELTRIAVAVDPPSRAESPRGALCGIVVAGRDRHGRAYVLDDRSLKASGPSHWANEVIAAYHDHKADRVVAELNQGGDLVEDVLHRFDSALPVKGVYATRGKRPRAEPVAALYERELVRHVGRFPDLEDQMCQFGASMLYGAQRRALSPDRLDALVWAITELLVGDDAEPQIRTL